MALTIVVVMATPVHWRKSCTLLAFTGRRLRVVRKVSFGTQMMEAHVM